MNILPFVIGLFQNIINKILRWIVYCLFGFFWFDLKGKKNYYKSLNNTKVEEKREEQREEMVVAENINSRNK